MPLLGSFQVVLCMSNDFIGMFSLFYYSVDVFLQMDTFATIVKIMFCSLFDEALS